MWSPIRSARLSSPLSDTVSEPEQCELYKSKLAVRINEKKLCARDLNSKIDACQGIIENDEKIRKTELLRRQWRALSAPEESR